MSRSRFSIVGQVGIAMLAFVTILAVGAPWIAPFPPEERAGQPFQRPSATYLLGTDDFGHDLFSQLLFGARASLAIGVAAAVVAVLVGFAIALVAGYFRGAVETVLMRVVDLMLAFPFFVLVVVLSAFFGRGLITTIVVIGGVIWARPARILRSQVIRIRELEHVSVATAMGASPWRVISRHILPRVLPLAVAQFVRAANVAVLIEASLSFLGLGDPNRVSWGTTLFFAQTRNAFLTDAWLWWIVPPGLALTTVIVGFAFVGNAVEEWADPRIGASNRQRVRIPTAVPVAPAVADAVKTLAIDHLSVEYRSDSNPVRAVADVTIDVRRGQVVGLVGESGSGKSTIVMTSLGLLKPPGKVTSGSVDYNGRDVGFPQRAGLASIRGREIALIPQNAMNALNPAYSILYQVAESAELTRTPTNATIRAEELLVMVGINRERHGAFPHELSGGMRQRVLIAMALANDPSLIVADEPVTGLDVVTQAHILDLLLGLRDRLGVGILLVSHDLPVVARVADEIVVLYAGSVVEHGPTDRVIANPAHPYTKLLLAAYPSLRGKREQLVSIGGEPPDLSNLPSGCAFHPRCLIALDSCSVDVPRLIAVEGDHEAACPVAQADQVLVEMN